MTKLLPSFKYLFACFPHKLRGLEKITSKQLKAYSSKCYCTIAHLVFNVSPNSSLQSQLGISTSILQRRDHKHLYLTIGSWAWKE